MNNAWRHNTTTQVPQAKTFTITAAGTGAGVWTFTFTDDDDSTATVTYTEDGSPTVAEIATGLTSAWNATTHPAMARIRATNPSAGVCVLTALTAGIPFSVALADSTTGTHTETDTTANLGNNDAGLARNWSLDAVPVATNDLIFEPGNVAVKYGLNLASVALADFKVLKGCQSDFGRFEFGKFHYLRIDPDSFDYRGNGGLALFDIGSAAIAPYIEAYGSPSVNGRHVIYLKGSAISTLKIAKGNVGLAVLDADTATVTTVLCGLLENPQSDVNLTIGSGVTLTTLTQNAGICLMKCAASGTVTVGLPGVLTTEGSGTIARLDVFGTAYPKSTGTITDVYAYGTVDFTRERASKTVTNMRPQPGCTIRLPPQVTVTNWIFPTTAAGSGKFNIELVA